MYTFTKREWDIMARPIYPNIQFTSSAKDFHIQSMVRLEQGEGEYYYALVQVERNINTIGDMYEFLDKYEEQVNVVMSNLNPEDADEYETQRLHKVTEE